MRNSIPLLSLAASIFAISTPLHTRADGGLHAYGYDTPAYIDFEFSEISTEPGDKTVSINLNRTGDFRQSTTIEYATEEITAVEGRDYKGAGGTITFQPGEGYKTITIDLLPNPSSETNRSFRVKLTGSNNYTVLMRDSVTISLPDGETALSLPAKLAVTAGSNGTILLSWQGEHQVLERSSNPASGEWEAVPCTPVATNGRFEVSQAAGGLFYAFRLRTE
jgi:hypothetical protein